MIPFWKKNKPGNAQPVQKRRQKSKPDVPHTAQQSIPMQRMFDILPGHEQWTFFRAFPSAPVLTHGGK